MLTKTRRCKVCRAEYQPIKPLQKVCNYDCALSLAASTRAKEEKVARVKEKRQDKVKRESLKRRADYVKEAQTAFNAWVRARDAGKPCICCGQPLKGHDSISGHNVDAGHYRSVGSAPHLRFVENNCHAQLVACNRYGSGRAVDYRIGLIARIGLEAVEALEADQTPRKYTVDELKAIKAKYQLLTKELKANQSLDDLFRLIEQSRKRA